MGLGHSQVLVNEDSVHLLNLTISSHSFKMKFNAALIMALALSANAVSPPTPSEIAKCGDLGVTGSNDTALPPGVDPSQVRTCVDHPLSNETIPEPSLEKRECYYGSKDKGCDKGYCWKKCKGSGEGPWCWTARNGGFGDWYTCGADKDCKTSYDCGQSLKPCGDCGCSC